MKQRETRRGALCVLLASLLFSVGGLCLKLIPWPPLAINGARNAIAAVVVGAYMALSRHKLRCSRAVLIGALAFMGTTTLYTAANKMTTAANAIVLQFTAPVFVILFSRLIFKKRPEKLDLVTCALVLGGVGLFFIDSLQAGDMAGNLVAVLSGVCYAGVCMMNEAEGADPLSSVLIGEVACGVLFAPLCLSQPPLDGRALCSLLALGVFQVGMAYVLFSLGIERTPPVTASLFTGIEPVLNPLLVAVFYHETISPAALAGAALVIGSVVAYNVLKSRVQTGQ